MSDSETERVESEKRVDTDSRFHQIETDIRGLNDTIKRLGHHETHLKWIVGIILTVGAFFVTGNFLTTRYNYERDRHELDTRLETISKQLIDEQARNLETLSNRLVSIQSLSSKTESDMLLSNLTTARFELNQKVDAFTNALYAAFTQQNTRSDTYREDLEVWKKQLSKQVHETLEQKVNFAMAQAFINVAENLASHHFLSVPAMDCYIEESYTAFVALDTDTLERCATGIETLSPRIKHADFMKIANAPYKLDLLIYTILALKHGNYYAHVLALKEDRKQLVGSDYADNFVPEENDQKWLKKLIHSTEHTPAN